MFASNLRMPDALEPEPVATAASRAGRLQSDDMVDVLYDVLFHCVSAGDLPMPDALEPEPVATPASGPLPASPARSASPAPELRLPSIEPCADGEPASTGRCDSSESYQKECTVDSCTSQHPMPAHLLRPRWNASCFLYARIRCRSHCLVLICQHHVLFRVCRADTGAKQTLGGRRRPKGLRLGQQVLSEAMQCTVQAMSCLCHCCLQLLMSNPALLQCQAHLQLLPLPTCAMAAAYITSLHA